MRLPLSRHLQVNGKLPALRELAGDIAELAQHFAQRVCESNGWKERRFLPEAIDVLERHTWPGNVRELRNCVERILMLSDGDLNAASVAACLPHLTPVAAATGTLSSRVEAFERESILEEFRRHGYNMAETARALGLKRSHLYKKCAQLFLGKDRLLQNIERAQPGGADGHLDSSLARHHHHGCGQSERADFTQ